MAMDLPSSRLEIARLQAVRLNIPDPEAAAREALVLEYKGIIGIPDGWQGEVWDTPRNFGNMLAHGRAVPRSPGEGQRPASVVYVCINTIATNYIEPRLAVLRLSDDEDARGEYYRLPRHRIYKLLRKPNAIRPDVDIPAMTIAQMEWYNQWCKHIDGNAYWRLIRSGHPTEGNVVSMLPVAPSQMLPVTERQPGRDAVNWIDYWRRIPDPMYPNHWVREDVRNIVHFRLGVDPLDQRLGLGPIKMLAREITTSRMADIYTSTLLNNFAVPPIVVIPDDSQGIEPDEADAAQERLNARISGDNVGKVAVLSSGAKVIQLGYDPQSMSLDAIHRHVERRAAAVFNVPLVVAQL